jgi:hypothetical protein
MHSIAQTECTVTWRSHELAVAVSQYPSPPNTCIDLVTETGERYATATTRLAQPLPPDMVAIKDYSENAGIQQALIDAGVIEPEPWGWVDSGYVRVYIFPLTESFLHEQGDRL